MASENKPDLPNPWTPDQPLRADATDADMIERRKWIVQDRTEMWRRASPLGTVAREFAEALVAEERDRLIAGVNSVIVNWGPIKAGAYYELQRVFFGEQAFAVMKRRAAATAAAPVGDTDG
jgi:hypothetical protein